MDPNQLGKKLGIGVRIAGRIAQQRMQDNAARQASPAPQASPAGYPEAVQSPHPAAPPNRPASPSNKANAHKLTRAAGRGVGGFLRPFGRVGGILWLEITGFFFGMFALYFAQDIWRTRLSYAAGPQHNRFLIAIALTLVFGYLSASAFWRAKRR